MRRNERRLAELEVACDELKRHIDELKQQIEGDRQRLLEKVEGQLPLWDSE